MAKEQNSQIGPDSQASAAAAQNTAAQQNQNGDRPAWLPEKFKSPEEFASSYNELEKWKGDTSSQLALLKKYEQWGNPDDLEQRLTAYIEKEVANRAAANARGDTQAARQAQANIDNATIEFESLSATDAAKLEKLLTERAEKFLTEKAEGYWRQAQAQLGVVNQQNDLLIKAMDLKYRNPELDLNEIWKAMAEIAKGDTNTLMNKAVESVLAPKKTEQMIKDAVAAERAKWDQERKNQEIEVLNGSNTLSARLRGEEARPKTRQDKKTAILSKFLQEGKLTANQL